LLAHLQQKVKVIGHPAIRMQTRAISLSGPGHNGVQEQPVGIDAENVLLMIAPERDVIKATRNMNAQSARHANLFRQKRWHQCRTDIAITRRFEHTVIVEILSPHFPHPAP
jgi:hypothetical protein